MQKPSASELAQISILLNPKLARENPEEALRLGMVFWEAALAMVDEKVGLARLRKEIVEEQAASGKDYLIGIPLTKLNDDTVATLTNRRAAKMDDETVAILTEHCGGKRYAIKTVATLRKRLGKKPDDPIYREEIDDYFFQLKKKHSEKQVQRRREKNAVNKPVKTDTKKSKRRVS